MRGAVLAAALAAAAPAAAAPQRVVSMNLCTDQLAMLVAAPGQLHSVSWLAADPSASVLHEEARAFPVNHGLAEEVFVMQPDLVLAGTFTSRATVAMLRRLGFEVVEFAPEASLDDIRANIRRMGEALDRAARAEELVAELDARLDALPPASGAPPRAALYSANSYTSGAGSLSDAVVRAAGFANVAAELGIAGTARLPLEALVMAAPDVVITGRRFTPPSLAEAVLDHPALTHIHETTASAVVSDAYWICGAPFTAEAAASLAALRDGLAHD